MHFLNHAWMPALLLVGTVYVEAAIDASGCGSNKTCVWSADNCDTTDPACLFASFAWNHGSGTVDIELSGGSGSGNQYVAVAFSSSTRMEDSDLYYCTGTNLHSGAIQGLRQSPATDANLPAEITNRNVATVGGVAECRFTRAASVTKTISNNANKAFDLSTTNYYVLLAMGDVTGGSITYHGSSKYSTSSAVAFTQFPMAPPITERVPTSPGAVTTGATITTYPPVTNSEVVTMTTASTPTTTPTMRTSNFTAGCGTSNKGCYSSPTDCMPGNSNCMFVSWSYLPTSNAFNFVIVGGSGNMRQYAAIAFASSNLMQDADMYYCTASNLVSGVIRESQRPPVNLQRTPEITNTQTGTNNAVLHCSFTRAASVTKAVSGSRSVNFDLGSNAYYLLYATGETNAGGALQYHGQARTASAQAIKFKNSALSFHVNFFTKHAIVVLASVIYCFGSI